MEGSTTPKAEDKKVTLGPTSLRPQPSRANANGGPQLGSLPLQDALKRLRGGRSGSIAQSEVSSAATQVTDEDDYDADREKAYEAEDEDPVSPDAMKRGRTNLTSAALAAQNAAQTNGHLKQPSDASTATPINDIHSRYASTDSIFPGKGFQRSASMGSHRSFLASSKPHPTPGVKRPDRTSYFDFKSVEETRLDQDAKKEKHWKRWGPYLSERQWATVREDYSGNGDAWTHFPHEQARSRAYRWGEDGIAGISDNHQRLCFAVGLWNEKDPILKERMFGVTGHQGNHGEDVKEIYYYLDNTPTHSYMKYLYKYPQREYPYERLVSESQQRGRDVVEFEITDTDAFDDDAYWDVFVEYAKDAEDADAISIRITAYNRGPEPANLHIVPNLWFRNTWSWAQEKPKGKKMPNMSTSDHNIVQADHETLGTFFMHACDSPAPVGPRKHRQPVFETEGVVVPELLFTDNDTNLERLYNVPSKSAFTKDAFHDHIIERHRPGWVDPQVLKAQAEENARKRAERLRVYKDAELRKGAEEKVADIDATGLSRKTSMPPTENELPEGDQLPPEAISTSHANDLNSDPATPVSERRYVNPDRVGTKAAAHYVFEQVPPRGGCAVVRLRLVRNKQDELADDEELFDKTIEDRRQDADEFYARFNSHALTDDMRNIMRQALSGMLWNKQFYHYVQQEWLHGDPGQPPPPYERQFIRNREWKHLHIENILSMPDKWEYPFFAVWDTAFHTVPLAMVDPAFAKNQLDVMTREWFMRQDGQLPAYEWNYGDVNPPVHAWATFRVFKLERKMYGREDLKFLERVFQKLLLNFTWWACKKDSQGHSIFEGGFLGLDNIALFNRSEALPTGGTLHQADGTSWMAFYALQMMNIALELAKHNDVYEDIASKFCEHFITISDAMSYQSGDVTTSLWNEEDGFYYDTIDYGNGHTQQLPVRSLVGLMPLYGSLTLEPGTLKRFPGFKKRFDWFMTNRSEVSQRNIASMSTPGKADRRLLAMVNKDRLKRILTRMLNEDEFLSDFGIRSLSREHLEKPYYMDVKGETYSVHYWPGDSQSPMFGGNSNWRGPIWLATTALLIESLQRLHQYYGPDFKVECPTGSGDFMTLAGVADEIQHRLIHIFARDHNGERAYNGGSEKLNKDPHFRDYVHFYEYFHGDNGRGIGASHQCGWTGWIAYAIWQVGHSARLPKTPRTPRATAAHYFDETVPPTPAASDLDGFTTDGGETELEPDEL